MHLQLFKGISEIFFERLLTSSYILQKDFISATKFISKYVHENPNDSRGWIELCLCLKRAEKYELALGIGGKILLANDNSDIVCSIEFFS